MCNKVQIRRMKIMDVEILKFIYSPTQRTFSFKTKWQGQSIVYHPKNESNMQQIFEELRWFKAQLAKNFHRAKFEVDIYSDLAVKHTGTKTWLTLQPEGEINNER